MTDVKTVEEGGSNPAGPGARRGSGGMTTASVDAGTTSSTACMEGRTRLPAFLIHDSPREADLGLGIYRRLFHFVRALEDVGARPSFQYVVTTTTSPPDELRTEPWLVATLGGAAGERLLRRDL